MFEDCDSVTGAASTYVDGCVLLSHLQRQVKRQGLAHLQGERSACQVVETRRVGFYAVAPRHQRRGAVQSVRIGHGLEPHAGVQVRDLDARGREGGLAGVLDTAGNRAVPALCRGKCGEKGESQDPAKAHTILH